MTQRRRDAIVLLAAAVIVASLLIYGVGAIAFSTRGHAESLHTATNLPSRKLSVTIEGGPEHIDCQVTARRTRHRCGEQVWSFVGPYAGRVAGEPRRCLWVHPQPGGARTVLTWDAVQIGAEVSATMALMPGSGGGRPVKMRILIGGREVGRVASSHELEPGHTSAKVPPGPRRDVVRVEIRASNNRWRLACMTLHMRGKRRAASADKPDKPDKPDRRGHRGR